jgi:periodic tryptophan protein 2
VCGCSYKTGNIAFSPVANVLLSPVGNRVTAYDLDANASRCLDVETRKDVSLLRVSPDGKLAVLVDLEGYAVCYDLARDKALSHFRFKKEVAGLSFSPDGKFIAAAFDREIRIYEKPPLLKVIEPFVQVKKINTSHSEDISGLYWSPDSRFLCSTSKDCNVLMHNVFSLPGYVTQKFVGHRKKVLQVFWDDKMERTYTMGKDGVLYIWAWKTDVITSEYKSEMGFQTFKRGKKLKVEHDVSEATTMIMAEEMGLEEKDENPLMSYHENHFKEGRWILESKKQFFQDGTQLKSAQYSSTSKLLLLGYKNGIFGLYRIEGEETVNLQVFSVTDKKISHLAFNHTSRDS